MDGPRLRSGTVLVSALLACSGVLASCGGGGGDAGEPVSSVAEFALGGDTPEAREFVLVPRAGRGGQPAVDLSSDLSVSWVNDGQYLGVVTVGSGSCPTGPEGIEVVADQEIEIHLEARFPDRDPCSADMSAYVTVVELPRGVTPTKPLVARFGGHEVTIPAVAR